MVTRDENEKSKKTTVQIWKFLLFILYYVCQIIIVLHGHLNAEEEHKRGGAPIRLIIHGHPPPNQDNNNNGDDSSGRLVMLPDSIQLLFDLAGQFHYFNTLS